MAQAEWWLVKLFRGQLAAIPGYKVSSRYRELLADYDAIEKGTPQRSEVRKGEEGGKFQTPVADQAAVIKAQISRIEGSLPAIRNAVAITSGKLRKK